MKAVFLSIFNSMVLSFLLSANALAETRFFPFSDIERVDGQVIRMTWWEAKNWCEMKNLRLPSLGEVLSKATSGGGFSMVYNASAYDRSKRQYPVVPQGAKSIEIRNASRDLGHDDMILIFDINYEVPEDFRQSATYIWTASLLDRDYDPYIFDVSLKSENLVMTWMRSANRHAPAPQRPFICVE